MNERIKKIWIDALESGDYAQAEGTLRRDDTFCCLGVLCDLFSKEQDEPWVVENDSENHEERYDGYDAPYWSYYQQSDVLPTEVRDWAGLANSNPICLDNDNLADLNDRGTSFEEIADVIREEL